MNCFSTGISVSMAVQCLYTILNALWALWQYLVTNVGLSLPVGVSVCSIFLLLVLVFKALLALMENFTCLSRLAVTELL